MLPINIMLIRSLRNLLCASVPLVVTACSSDDPAGTATQEDYDQVAGTLAGNTSSRGELAAVGVISDLATGLVVDGVSLDASGRFAGDHGGLIYEGTLTCIDIGLSEPVSCGPTTTTASVMGMWTGYLALARLSIDLRRTGTWTLSGLQTSTVMVNGSSHANLISHFASASDANHKDLVLVADATYNAIAIDRASHWPIGGEIVYAISGTRTHTTPGLDASQGFVVDATLTLHADHSATVVIDGDVRYDVDLEAGEVRPERN
jgi:hypothetical protein